MLGLALVILGPGTSLAKLQNQVMLTSFGLVLPMVPWEMPALSSTVLDWNQISVSTAEKKAPVRTGEATILVLQWLATSSSTLSSPLRTNKVFDFFSG